jgi:hypothetical protein
MSENEGTEETRVTLRLPADVYAEVVAFAKGNGRRPKASLNATLVFLIRVGLAQQTQQRQERNDEPGQWVPSLAAAA